MKFEDELLEAISIFVLLKGDFEKEDNKEGIDVCNQNILRLRSQYQLQMQKKIFYLSEKRVTIIKSELSSRKSGGI